MKLQRSIDKRFVSQLVIIALLFVLPIWMVMVNGTKAMKAILFSANKEYRSVEHASEEGRTNITGQSLKFGVYDHAQQFSADNSLELRHVYFSWGAFDEQESLTELSNLERRGFQPMLTIEPWPAKTVEGPLMRNIADGRYDEIVDTVARVLNQLRGPIYISWGHEMDQDLTQRYPWSGVDPKEYVKAYRHVVDRFRQQVQTELLWVWAGVLKSGSEKYWPGENYVDFIGMPIYSFPSWDRKQYGYIRDFRTTFLEKQKVVKQLAKPLMITEMGVSGSDDFKQFWMHQAFLSFSDFPNLMAIIFFQAPDTEGVWGNDVETPNWQVHPDLIRTLVDWKLRESAPID